MRQIKFRAWSGNVKQMLYWPQIINDPDNWLQSLFQGLDSNDVLMQFTGLLDKNGKEIWESDIVRVDWNDKRYEPHNVEVTWNEIDLRWEIEGGCLTTDNHHFEVIGNIYQNPELLQ